MRFAKLILPLAAVFFFGVSFVSAQSRNSSGGNARGLDEENARVARISLIRGDVQIKRNNENEWENAIVNLPIVEGDMIATDRNARVEIQIGKDNFARLAGSSLLEVVTLRNKGEVALSLPEGILSLTVGEFNADRDFIEIDAPKTTVSIEKIGSYRIDAERDGASVFVAAFDGGSARAYSDGAGFTIRNGKRAELSVRGDSSGEFRTESFTAGDDDWTRWTRERDEYIAQRRNRSEQYYDREIYGADELSDYGEWVYSRDYGYVWRPNAASRGRFDNWSPYRYGAWRYIAPFGWVWVSDEPWGYATSYYGRWVWVSGDWCWTPYFGVFPRWQPSHVIFTNVGRNVYWYPLPYDYHYTYIDRRRIIVRNTTIINNNTTVVVNPTPTPGGTPQITDDNQGIRPRVPPLLNVPNGYQTAVTGVPVEEFGKSKRNIKSAPLAVADEAVKAKPFFAEERYSKGFYEQNTEVKVRPNEQIVVKNALPSIRNGEVSVKTGADERDSGVKLGDRLRREVFNEERRPSKSDERRVTKSDDSAENAPTKTRDTGVFEREREKRPPLENPRDSKERDETPRESKRREKSEESDVFAPVRQPPAEDSKKSRKERDNSADDRDQRRTKRDEEPRYEPPPTRIEQPTRREEPRYEPPTKREEPRYEPPPKREEPPTKREEPRTKDGRR